MKWMKWFLVLAVGIAMGLGAVGCGGGDDDNGNPLVGSWRAQTFAGQPMPATVSLVLTFKDNGTAQSTSTINGVTSTENATWTSNGSVLVITSADGTDNVPYSISGNTLTISDPEGVFTLTKQ